MEGIDLVDSIGGMVGRASAWGGPSRILIYVVGRITRVLQTLHVHWVCEEWPDYIRAEGPVDRRRNRRRGDS